MQRARLTGLGFHGNRDVARARCDLSFERAGEMFNVDVPLIDALQFCAYVEQLKSHTDHHPLRVLCASAVGPPSVTRPGAREAVLRISRRVDVIESDAMLGRFWDRAVTDDIAVAVGESVQSELGIGTIGPALNRELRVRWRAKDIGAYYEHWDAFITAAETKAGREKLHARVREWIDATLPNELVLKIARLPVSNFIDASLGRALTKALLAVGKQPRVHDFGHMRIGEWEVGDPDRPHVFYVLGTPGPGFSSMRSLIADRSDGHVENILDMLKRKDLLLMNFHAFEAEYILRLPRWAADTGKIVNCAPTDDDPSYWARRGVYVSHLGPDQYVDGLMPAVGARYGSLDLLTAPEMLIDLARRKPNDCFISYSRQDTAFSEELDRGLRHHGVRSWRDVSRMKPGNPVTETIEREIAKAHTFVVILSPDAILSEWVQLEIRCASALRVSGELEAIIPVWFRDCAIPETLQGIHYVDARDAGRRAETIAAVATEIRDASAHAANKLR